MEMLLEMENNELLFLLESPHSLVDKVEEFFQVLNEPMSKMSPQDPHI
jgi:hypothetical protein